MGFTINDNALENNYLKTKKGKTEFNHITNRNFKLLPFVTNDGKIKSDKVNVRKDLATFKGIAGECYRLINYQKKLSTDALSGEKLIEQILEKAQVTNQPQIKSIIKKITFDENDNLFVFDEKIFSYIDFHTPTRTLENITLFFYTIFFDDKLRQEVELNEGQQGENNIYYELILNSLPKFKNDIKHRKDFGLYQNFAPQVVKMFRQDLSLMLGDKSFFIAYFPNLIKYYYFTYLKQLILNLNSFFGESSRQIFFTVEWESLSKSRISHQNGWNLFESKARNIFSFVNFFEMISYIEKDGKSFFKGNFQDIKTKIEKLSPAEEKELIIAIKDVNDFYRKHMEAHLEKPFKPGSSWADFDKSYKAPLNHTEEETPIYYQLHKLWAAINYQFIHSERISPYGRYQSWITEFCKLNFVRNRGRLGQSLSLDQDTLLFITRLCLGKEPKIRLKKLWGEYEKRGLYFDPSTQKEIVKLFEKINLLEKKSDSGDAQYVKTIQ